MITLEQNLPGGPALLGGTPTLAAESSDLFRWPIITAEDEDAVLEVLRAGNMSGTDVTRQFEEEFADWVGTRYAVGFNNGTASLQAADLFADDPGDPEAIGGWNFFRSVK